MKRKRFTEEQIIAVLKENEAGAKVDELCRRHGISSATFYTWRKKYGGMDASEAKRLRALEVPSIPVNFLIPIEGNRVTNDGSLTPERCLRTLFTLVPNIAPRTMDRLFEGVAG